MRLLKEENGEVAIIAERYKVFLVQVVQFCKGFAAVPLRSSSRVVRGIGPQIGIAAKFRTAAGFSRYCPEQGGIPSCLTLCRSDTPRGMSRQTLSLTALGCRLNSE